MRELWDELARRGGVGLSGGQMGLLERYIELLVEGNARMNLTRITDRVAAGVGHVGDALTLLPYLPSGACGVADVGAGGGVPGIPVAIARPDVSVTLIEATKKKAGFLSEAVGALGLSNVVVVPLRAEEAGVGGAGGLRESFEVVTARAVATTDWLAEWCLPLAKVGGKVLLMKGPRHGEELVGAGRAIRLMGGGNAVVHGVELPGARGHVIVEIPKIAKTDKRYPREASVAKGKAVGGGGGKAEGGRMKDEGRR